LVLETVLLRYNYFLSIICDAMALNRICTVLLIPLLASCGGGGGAGGIPPAAPPASSIAMPPVQIDGAAHEDITQGLYVAYFGRPASPAELSTLSQAFKTVAAPTTLVELEKAYATNAEVRQLIDAFALTKEWKDQYLSTGYIGDDFSFVKAVYNNLFNRDPDIRTWETLAQSIKSGGVSRSHAALSVAVNAKEADADLAALKFRTASSFTRALNSGGKTGSYAGAVEHAMARALLQDIASDPEPAGVQGRLNSTIHELGSMAAGSVAEVPTTPRKIVLLVGEDQAAVQAGRLTTLASLLAADLNSRLGPHGQGWSTVILPAASTAYQVRQQLSDVHGAILIGNVPVPIEGSMPALDAYRLPKCKAIQFQDGATKIISRTTVIENDPDCRNGATISVLRGTSNATQTAEISRKLDQMIAYHRDSQQANAAWERHFTLVDALWSGGAPWPDVSALWDRIAMFAKDKITEIASGIGSERRTAFLECLSSKSEMCSAYLHGAENEVMFEGPGTVGTFYSSDTAWLSSSDLAKIQIKSKYVEMISCSTQNFLIPNSFGTTLLMVGDALLSHGFVAVTAVSDGYQANQIRNQYFLLGAGATFADAWLGQAEHGPVAFQGDPYITMRPVADAGKRPVLVVNGKHFNGGSAVVPIDLPDSRNGRQASALVVLSNRGGADLHVRIDSMVKKNGVDGGAGNTIESEYGSNAQYSWGRMLATADGRIPDPEVEQDGGRLPIIIKPGASVAYYYNLEVRTDAHGMPKRPGTYFGEVQILSNDPASARLHLGLRTRVY
jgi:hypothetical protein